MRTHLLAVLGLALTACAGEITSSGGDDTGGAVCGNGTIEAGEQCDDGNMAVGDGCSATCQTEVATPKLAIGVDKASVTTELMTSNKVQVSLTASGGFSGSVTLQGSIVDSTNAPITDWTVMFDNASLTVPANGTATAMATVMIPSATANVSGTVHIDAVSSLGTVTASAAVTAANQVTFPLTYDANIGCVYSVDSNTTVQVKVGTKVRWISMASLPTQTIAIHSDGAAEGICHEAIPCNGDPATPNTLAPNDTYEQTAKTAGNAFIWYCHTPGNQPGGKLQVVN